MSKLYGQKILGLGLIWALFCLQNLLPMNTPNVAIGSNVALESTDLTLPTVAFGSSDLKYASFLGGGNYDGVNDFAVDSAGCVYITGYANNDTKNFPTTPNAINRTHNGVQDVFVSKFSADGSTLLYSTFLGGSSYDYANAICVDSVGCAYIAGVTTNDTKNFPTTSNAINRTHNGVTDIFVCKISADGSTLLYSTLLGGLGSDGALAIAIDSSGCVFITGNTENKTKNFPTTTNAINRTHNGFFDVFVCKISADGSNLLYSTFLGGYEYDSGTDIVVDSAGCAFITGQTNSGSKNFPTTANAMNKTHNGQTDAFICKLNAAGSALLYSTFLGGSFYDYAYALDVDAAGCAYIAGNTESPNDFPTTPGAYNSSYCGMYDVFVSKLNVAGSGLIYSTYIGQSDCENLGLVVDEIGYVYIVGCTNNQTGFPTTANAFNRTIQGDYDIFLCKIGIDGTTLEYSTFIGGAEGEYGLDIAMDAAGYLYFTGQIYSNTTFPATPGAVNETNNGFSDVVVCKMDLGPRRPSWITTEQVIYNENLTVQWNAIAGNPQYDIYVNGILNESTMNTNQLIHLRAEGVHNITIRAIRNGYQSPLSPVLRITVDTIPPSPNWVTSSQTITTKNITVEWTAVVTATQYKIYVNGSLNATVTGGGTSQIVMLNVDGIYHLSVSAIRNGFESTPSPVIVITVDLPPEPPVSPPPSDQVPANFPPAAIGAFVVLGIGGVVGIFVVILKKRAWWNGLMHGGDRRSIADRWMDKLHKRKFY